MKNGKLERPQKQPMGNRPVKPGHPEGNQESTRSVRISGEERKVRMAKDPEQDIFALFEQAKQKAPDEEQKLTDAINSQLQRLNMIRTTFLNKPVLSLREAGSSGGGKGRPKGFKMTEEQKQRMKEGRAKAKAARESSSSA